MTGRPDFLNAALPPVEFESARALGNVWALNELWETLGFGELRRVFRRTRHTIDIEALIRKTRRSALAGDGGDGRWTADLP